MIKASLILFIIFPISLFASSVADNGIAKNLHESQQWMSLIHYKKSFFGSYTSEADDEGFFFAKDGRSNPKSELRATIDAFFTSENFTDPNEHPVCRFPARFIYLKKHINELSSLETMVCPKRDKFFKKLSIKSVSLIFSSYFLDTPASAFGHTFLRMSKTTSLEQKQSERFELLDYAANYAATVTSNNAFIYGLWGLAGGFKGEFASMPYFYKVREYNDFESRDLWDYELNLNDEELIMVVSHLWEMSNTFFYYYYLTENCSYHMLGLLDVANPKWQLTNRNPYFVIPVDTIKTVVNTPGLVRKVSFRPSKMRFVKKRLAKLNPQEEKGFTSLIKKGNPNKLVRNYSNEQKAKIFDAAIDFIDFKYAEDVLLEKSEAMKWKRKLLIARSKTGIAFDAEEIKLPKSEQPHTGHDPRRLGLTSGYASKRGGFSQLEYRFVLHDLLDPKQGQNPNASMEMGNLKLRLNHKDKIKGNKFRVEVDDFALIKVTSLSPLKRHLNNYTWRFYVGAQTVKDKGCEYCFAPTVQVGAGYSQRFSDFTYALLTTTEAQLAKELSHEGARLGVGPEALILYSFTDSINAKIFGEYKYRVFGDNDWTYNYGAQLRTGVTTNLAIDTHFTRNEAEWQSGATLYYYY